jgi:hypothetical protein
MRDLTKTLDYIERGMLRGLDRKPASLPRGNLDLSFGVSFSLSFGRNTCSGYTTSALFAVTGARHARIEDFGTKPDSDPV